ncbi:hypothetical protein A1OE_1358 [Candidatus Endolissoclinum faulkneri L2]|uniref:Uncharacterized protein n=1 Tax=Candidatus Endolissoclinum faulkneri L2 TaxID=1193729 RepID=K7YIU2_9PROT|nr:hypothetical protein A1OE_1358 [Candidatus Endolissoclinum faulkneri L2]
MKVTLVREKKKTAKIQSNTIIKLKVMINKINKFYHINNL